MAGETRKGVAGQTIRSVPASDWNNMLGAGEAFARQQLGKQSQPITDARSTDIIKCRNETGGDRSRGEIVCFGDLIISDLTPEHMWVQAKATRRGARFGVLKHDVLKYDSSAGDAGIAAVQLSGVTLARVDIKNKSHRAARVPSDGSFVLQSSFSGPVSITWAPDETGEADCIVRLRGDSVPVFKTPAGGIGKRTGTTCGTADCVPYYIDDTGKLVELKDHKNASQTVQIKNVFGSDIGKSVYITAKDVFGVLVADAEDCE